MKKLEERILNEGQVLPGQILRVDNFLNHQIDTTFVQELAKEIYEHFKDKKIDKIFTVEASGIALAYSVALEFKVPLLFAKKAKSANIGNVYSSTVESYTYGKQYEITIDKKHCIENENVLIIDDFLATGNALDGLLDVSKQAKFNVVGIGIAIEKGYQGGGDELRKLGYDVYSLAIIDSMEDDKIVFRQ